MIKFWGWIAAIAIFSSASGCATQPGSQPSHISSGSTNNSSPLNSNQAALSPSSKSLHKIGEVVSIKDKTLNLQFTVNGTREHPGKGVIKPNRGHKWVVVDMTITNQGKEAKTFSVVSFAVIDHQNNQYEVALLAGALDDIETPTGEIIPGKERRGELAFEVPENSQQLKLLFQPNSSECESYTHSPQVSASINCDPIVIQLY